MKKYLLPTAIAAALAGTGIAYGIAIHKFNVFPYSLVKNAYENLNATFGNEAVESGPWAIGLYSGPSPFELNDPASVSNPIIRAEDLDDIDAVFVADPFLIVDDEKYFIFFEALNRANDQGDIGLASSADGIDWHYQSIVLDEPFHLSYPLVFRWNNEYYLVPESAEDFSVRIYKAASFPHEWNYAATLLSGYRYADPTIFRHDERWWMFVSAPGNDSLNLYHSDELTSGWQPHPLNPIVKGDGRVARPAGRVIDHDGRLFRFAQDDQPSYGRQVFAFEITELTTKSYAEKMVAGKPVVGPSGTGWNASGMHHVDPQQIENGWLAAVDGKYR